MKNQQKSHRSLLLILKNEVIIVDDVANVRTKYKTCKEMKQEFNNKAFKTEEKILQCHYLLYVTIIQPIS